MPSTPDCQSRHFYDLQNIDLDAIVPAAVRSLIHQPIIKELVSLLDVIQKDDLRRFISEILSTLTDKCFYAALFNSLKAHVEAHPWETAFFIIGIVLMLNPLALAGFGALGPVAGSLAAAWQASIGGTVAARSAFATLQRWGMAYAIAIPVTGGIITAGSVISGELERMRNGALSDSAIKWWNDIHNSPVTQWRKFEISVANLVISALKND